MANEASPPMERVRAAEVIAALSLATDLAMGVPLEHGLQSTLLAMRLADRLNVDAETAAQIYYACQLFYVGCTANADAAAELFGADDALTTYASPSRFGSRPEMAAGFLRAVAPPGGAPLVRVGQLARRLPTIGKVVKQHIAAFCEVARMLTDRLGIDSSVGALFAQVAERWDGKGEPGRARGDQISLAMRIVHVAQDATFQRMLGGAEYAASVVRKRAGHAFDPEVVAALTSLTSERLGFLPRTRLRPGMRRSPASSGRAHSSKATRSTVLLPPWAISLISSRRASSDTPPASPCWL